MPADGDTRNVEARTYGGVREVDAATWDALAHPPGAPYNPFTSHAFLTALEASKSVGDGTGWHALPVIVSRDGAPVAAAPLYAKQHSQGEYVFDHHWAAAFERAGGRYFPKLVVAAPFTPAQGPRFLAADDAGRRLAAAGVLGVAAQAGVSSVHVNFVDEADAAAGGEAGMMLREGVQYHWFNRGYATFDEFLDQLASRKRKTIRRERRDAAASGLAIKRLQGAEITERHWDAFWTFYQDTGARKWGMPYLTRSFFRIVAETMTDDLLLIVAESDGEPIAGALNFIGGDAVYGRYWGCVEHRPFLHFELCYHQAIDFAIERGLARVEAGAQGEHKIARGYEPVATRSLHWIADPGFREAIARYLEQERSQTEAEIDILGRYAPYKKTSS
ncbi:MAG: GNAT family N-acetyltransferase [Parvularculaceae bacterium]